MTIQELEKSVNAADFNRQSKDNNKNNQRINAFFKENFPTLKVEFHNNKKTGIVTVEKIFTEEQVQKIKEQSQKDWKEQQARERFFKRVKTKSGNKKLQESLQKHLEKAGFDEATITVSRSIYSSLSFYIENDGTTVKISDHYTIGQQVQHPDDYFINLKEMTSFKEIWNLVEQILRK